MMNIKQAFIFYAILVFFTGCAETPKKIADPIAVPIDQRATIHLRALASQAAFKYGIDQNLFHALVKHESAWNPYAVSRRGARGLTQLMPGTGWSYCGLRRDVLFDPKLNLNCGAYYFSKLLRRFKSVRLALAAYNSGETRVARLGRVPRIRETQRYVRRIMSSWQNSYQRR